MHGIQWHHLAVLWLAVVTGVVSVRAADDSDADWPQFLGPKRNLHGGSTALVRSFPAGGPKVVWEHSVAEGYSGPVVSGGKVVMFHRQGGKETIDCLDATTGKPIWKTAYVADYRDGYGMGDGPRGTPCIADGRIYAHGVSGILSCIDFKTGKIIWQVDTQKEFGSPPGFFGRACSPLIEGELVLLNIGGPNAGLAAFDRKTGKTVWTATKDEAGYASPVAASIKTAKGQQRFGLFYTRENFRVLEPTTGKVLFTKYWRSSNDASVNAATPLVVDDLVFISSSYDTGAMVLKIDPAAGKATELWSGDNILSNHYSTSLYHNGFLYGFDGRQETGQRLRCVELRTGKIKWTKANLAAGTLLIADKKLLILNEDGELIIAPVSSSVFEPTAKARILRPRVRSYPALARGFLYARDGDRLICVDLRSK